MRLWCGPPLSVSRVVHLASCSATFTALVQKATVQAVRFCPGNTSLSVRCCMYTAK